MAYSSALLRVVTVSLMRRSLQSEACRGEHSLRRMSADVAPTMPRMECERMLSQTEVAATRIHHPAHTTSKLRNKDGISARHHHHHHQAVLDTDSDACLTFRNPPVSLCGRRHLRHDSHSSTHTSQAQSSSKRFRNRIAPDRHPFNPARIPSVIPIVIAAALNPKAHLTSLSHNLCLQNFAMAASAVRSGCGPRSASHGRRQ